MKYIRQFLLAALMLMVGAVHAQTCVATAGVTTCTYSIPDDGYAIVPIPFGFPYYGRIFTHSLFFDNGVVSFYSPTDPMRFGGQDFNAQSLSNNTGSNFHYSIMPMWSDLVNYSGSHTTETDGLGYLRYNWNNVSQWGYPDRLNTFSLEIRSTGYIGIDYQKINIDGYPITAGTVGNASLGEWHQHYHKPAPGSANLSSISNWSFNETYGADCSNPLNNANCPGYAEAFFAQQCSLNTLYSSLCPGYAQAYFDQQCSVNSLYHSGCSGYAQAYFDQQCSISPLYNDQCPGYAQAYFNQQCSISPLYNDQCPGYADAYYVQQCTADPLYDSGCTGYDAAYLAQQCSLNTLYDSNCPGYAQAYFDQQCSLNALYNDQCPGYATAFYNLQCNVNPLYDSGCPGYAQAYFDQQCSTDALYNSQCPGYAEAYALRFIINSPNTTTTTNAVEEPAAITAAVTEEKPVTAAVESTAAATARPAEPAAPVQLVAAAPAPAAAAQPATAPAARTEPAAAPAPRTTRQAMAEQRLAAAREAAAKEAQDNPGAVAAEMDAADNLERQAEIQNVVLGAMGFVAGFDAYGRVTLPDGVGYRPFEIYPGQQNIDTPAARGLIGRSDQIHEEMVNEQYR
jgi:hypothetical protein